MLCIIDDENYELCKYASIGEVKETGNLVLENALNDAKGFAKRIFIATNTKCKATVHLYEKFGFKLFKSDEKFGFYRVNLLYEKYLN